MDFHANLLAHLDALTEHLTNGSDLGAIIHVLVDDLTAAVPSLLGLDITIMIGTTPVTVSTMTPAGSANVRSSLRFPLTALTDVPKGSVVTYYAATPAAFTQLATETRDALDLNGDVQVDEHLTPAGADPLTGLGELAAVNQAIGILLGQDDLGPDEALEELQRRADIRQVPIEVVAQQLAEDPTS